MVNGGAAWRREAGYFIELLGITAVAIAQPVFSVIQQSPEELVNRRAGSADLVVFAVALTLGPPVVLWLLEQPFRLAGQRVRAVVHTVFLSIGVGLFLVELLKSLLGAEPRAWLWVVGPLAAVAAGLLLARSPKVRSGFRYLALAAPLFVAVFLFFSPVSDLVVGGTTDPADVAITDPAPVVVIALDELPLASLLDGEGRIDAATYPAFAELAGDATWFRNTTGVSPVTPSALPAILTGRLPDEIIPAPVATKFDETLYTLLGGQYDVDVVETLTRLCPPSICETEDPPARTTTQRLLFGLAREVFDGVASPSSDATELEFVIERNPADELAAIRFHEFTAEVAQSEGLTLDVGHFLLPHQPWDFLASGRTYEAPDPPRSVEFGGWHDQITADAGRQRHIVQLEYTDRLLGRFLDQMKASGRYDESLVILTADHGAAFVGGEPLRGVSEENYPQIMWTPLFVKVPGQTEGAVDDRATETIDIVPTIADVLGIDLPWEVDGTSVFEPAPDDRPVRMYEWRFNDAPPDEDGFVVLDREAGFAEVLAGANPALGSDSDPFVLYRMGEFGDLLGQRVDDLDVGPPAGFELTSERSTEQFTITRGDRDLPAYVEGIWEGEADGWLVLAVDGTLVGMGRAYLQGEFATVWSLLPESVLTAGDHELRVYAVTGSPSSPQLHPVPIVPPDR